MSWRQRQTGYVPTWAELQLDVLLGTPAEEMATEVAEILVQFLSSTRRG